MKFSIPLSLLLLSSCSSYRVVVETGVADPILGAQYFVRDVKGINPLQASASALRVETTLYETKHFAVDQGIGPEFVGGHQGTIVGVQQATRIRWKLTHAIHPYIMNTNGMGYAQGWRDSDVSYMYTTSFGIGTQFNIRPRLCIGVDYRWIHASNGMTMHSDKFRQFFHLRHPQKNLGYQNGGIFASLIFSF